MSDHLPRDIHLQILKRLPLNSILQCRTVCKSWNSLITSNEFISAYQKCINGTPTQTLLIRYFDRTRRLEQYVIGKDDETFGLRFSALDFRYESADAYFRIVGYCDGVACLSDDLFGSMSTIILWNPSIRKSVRVLVSDIEQLAWRQWTVLGFGVCPRAHDPKIVRIVYVEPQLDRIQDPPMVQVFSLKSGVWRKPFGGNHNPPHKMLQITWSQVCFNGAIHWIAWEKQPETRHRCLIMAFDLAPEVFVEMPLPDALAHQHISKLSISIRKGYLTMIDYEMEKGNECCGVWAMKEYGVMESWEKLYMIRLPDFLRKVVGFLMNGDVVLALKNHELVTVGCTGNIRSLDIYANIRSFFLGLYMESLILINQMDQQMYPC